MIRLLASIAASVLLSAVSVMSAQVTTSGNITAAVTAPPSIECSAPFQSSLTLTGFDVQDPGVADIVFVLDESGSIPPTSFNQMKQFVSNLVNLLMPATNDGARVGIAMFSTSSRSVLPLTNNRQQVLNVVNAVAQQGGSTCIGCGIQQGRAIFNAAAPRPEATQFMIVLTDGANNENEATFPGIVASTHAAGITVFGIGVGPNVIQSEINLIASDIAGVQTAFFVLDFNQLSTIVTSLTQAIVSPGATNVVVDVTVQPRFPAATAAATAGAVQVAGSHVIWTLPSLGSAAQTLTLDHQHDGQGNGPLQIFNAIYTDTQGHIVDIPVPSTTVNGCNTAPVANAGVDQTVNLSGSTTASVTLDGSGSTDDGLIQPLSYSWASPDTPLTGSGPSPTLQLPFGTYVFTLTVHDGEFSDTDEVIVVVDDPTPPVVTASVVGTLGSNGWYTSNVNVTFTSDDPETGVAGTAGCDAASVNTDTTGQSFTCTATNGAGAQTSETETVKRDATPPSLTVSGPVTAEPTSAAGANVNYAAPAGADATSGLAAPASCAPASGSLFPPGTTTVGCSVTDVAGHTTHASFTVTVADTTPPVITRVTPSLATLWPPNHKMVDVAIDAAAIDSVSTASCRVTSISSSESANGNGDGNTTGDAVITGPLTVQLRAERSGKGPGRVYTIHVTCTDAAGNAATSSTSVSAPKSNGK